MRQVAPTGIERNANNQLQTFFFLPPGFSGRYWTNTELGVDFVALSFVRSADEVRATQELMRSLGRTGPVVVKLEKGEAIDELERNGSPALVLEAMVARLSHEV